MNHYDRIRRQFVSKTIAAGILSFPVLTDAFCRVIQPVRIGEQSNQFNRAKELHRIGPRLAQGAQFPRTDEKWHAGGNAPCRNQNPAQKKERP